jgi:hypothetical protein
VEREVVGVIVVSEVAWLIFNDCVRRLVFFSCGIQGMRDCLTEVEYVEVTAILTWIGYLVLCHARA